MVRVGSVALLMLAVGCAGRSIGTEETGGTSGAGGTSSGGSSGRGGETTGGSGGTGGSVSSGGSGGSVSSGGSGGSVSSGGSLQGGSGGSVSVGGAMTGGVGGGGTAGAAGAGAACGLPLVTGPCNAAFSAYGFDPMRGHCVRFTYGGCDGNDNRFDTLTECEDACGGSNVGGCPETRPDGTPCEPSMLQCTYNWQDGCLCASNLAYGCSKIDPYCPPILLDVPPSEDEPCVGNDCVSEIRVPPNYLCQCGGSAWTCVSQQ